ncbi:MAG: thioredoxin family protein [Gemmatimonadales bacterium]|nr:thioredoxin family protein [Gemmatimonadales bacterium]
MITPLLLLALHVGPAPTCDLAPTASATATARTPAAAAPRDSSLLALYESGVPYETFLAKAEARRAMWVRNSEQAAVAPDALASAQAIPGRWRILVSAVDGCSDSVNTIPYLAKLVALVPSLEMRIVQPGPGRVIMEAHRTPDGRPATPTVVILDGEGRDVGCWVERPAALQEMALKAREAGTLDEFQRNKQGWYDADAGASTVREVVAVIAAAAAGTPLCLQGR